jgi:hypothetical protein
MILLNTKVKILVLCLSVVVVISGVTAWYFLSQPKYVLSLKSEKPFILFGGILVDSTELDNILPEPIESYVSPTLPNISFIRIGFGKSQITTPKGSASTFIVWLTANIEGSGVSQITDGKLDYSVHEFVFKIYVDEEDAVNLLSELGLPVELSEIDFSSIPFGELQRETLVISNHLDTLLNITYLRETTSTVTVPAEPQQDITIKIGWIFGEEDNLKALRFGRDYNFGINGYPLVEGTLEVSASSPIYQVIGAKYDIAETLQQYLGVQGKLVPILDGGESHFINP